MGGDPGTTGTGAPPSLVADPTCASAGGLPGSPGPTSKPAVLVSTAFAFASVSVPVPEVVLYDDATFATIGVSSSTASLRSTAAAPATAAAPGRPAAIPPAHPALLGYRGGAVDPCTLEKIAAEGSALATLDYGATGILDGSLTRVEVLGGVASGGTPQRIGVENLEELDSERLTVAQRAARVRLLEWVDRLRHATGAGDMLPMDRIRVVPAGAPVGGRTSAEKPVAWDASTPSWAESGRPGCDLFTGRNAAAAVNAATRSSVLNQRQADVPELVYSGSFVVDGAPLVLTLVVAPPGIGCER